MHIFVKAVVLGLVAVLGMPASATAVLDDLCRSSPLCDLTDVPDLSALSNPPLGTIDVPTVLNGLPDISNDLVPALQLGDVTPDLGGSGASAPEIDPAAARGALVLVLGAIACLIDRRRY